VTHCTDDELTRKLKALRKPFEPASAEKRAMHHAVFVQKQTTAKRHSIHWKPALISFLLLISIVTTLTVLAGKPGALNGSWFAKDVTGSWAGIIMEQTSDHDVAGYYIYFDESTLHVENTNIGESFMGNVNITQAEVEKMADDYQAKLAKLTVQAGAYPNYTVKKKKDQYTITAPGENGFSYTLTKTAPRQFVGEDGIRYSVNNYTD